MPLKEAVNEVEKKLISLAQKEGKSTYEIADMLGVNQSTIVRKMKKYFHWCKNASNDAKLHYRLNPLFHKDAMICS